MNWNILPWILVVLRIFCVDWIPNFTPKLQTVVTFRTIGATGASTYQRVDLLDDYDGPIYSMAMTGRSSLYNFSSWSAYRSNCRGLEFCDLSYVIPCSMELDRVAFVVGIQNAQNLTSFSSQIIYVSFLLLLLLFFSGRSHRCLQCHAIRGRLHEWSLLILS